MVHAHKRGMCMACAWHAHGLRACVACAWCVHVARLVAEQEEPDCVGREEADDGQAHRGELDAREAARQRLACAKRLAWRASMAGCLTSHVHGMHLACAWHAVWTQCSMACACVGYLPEAEDALEDVDQAPHCEGVPSRQTVHRVREGDLCVGELNEAAGRHEYVGDDHEDEDDDDRDRLDCRSARRERRSKSRRHGGAWFWA